MSKYLAIGVHGEVDPEAGRAIAPRSLAWLKAGLASGEITSVYSMAGGGRLLIMEADSEDALRATLAAAPDLDRTWTINALTDAVESIERYLAATAT